MKQKGLLLIILCACLTGPGCDERIPLNAPYQDIWVVYGILNPDADTQVVRISLGFLPDTDAYVVARAGTFTVPDLEVRIRTASRIWYGTYQDSIRRDTMSGDFSLYSGVYVFDTRQDSMRLEPGEQYVLEIRRPGDSLFLQAITRIPPRPVIKFPRYLSINGERCLESVAFEDSVYVFFDPNPAGLPGQAYGFEIGVSLTESVNGVPRSYRYGTRQVFQSSVNCSQASGGALCYLFRDGVVIRGLRAVLPDSLPGDYFPEPRCAVLAGDLARVVTLDVTAIDTALARYLLANNPRGQDLTTIRAEITNITGSARAVGVWGSISMDHQPVSFTPCGEYLLGLGPQPSSGCD
ncbi:MAG: hypothetical protein SF053_06885 [Bacteroidia bacterium]|nr:hypothetical protein [Bacteroidia bacterium]